MSWLRQDWYFTGYQCEKRAKKKGKGTIRVYTYSGEYYGYGREGKEAGRVKAGYAFFAAWILISYLLAAFSNATGNKIPYIGLTFLFALLPLFYFCAGIITAMTQGERMTYRGYCGSYRRILRSLKGMSLLLILPCSLEIIFLLNHTEYALQGNEIRFLLSMLACFVGLICCLCFMKKKTCQIL